MAQDDTPAQLADVILEVATRAARTSPMPRGLPYLGLDHHGGRPLGPVEALAQHGIFRKYEQVLLLQGGLGAAARWASEVLACAVVATSDDLVEARAAQRLTDRARLGDQVHHVVVASNSLPLRDAAFTHVWTVDGFATVPDPTVLLREAARVVRPGGHLALQELVRGESGGTVARWHVRPVDWWRETVDRAGFVEVKVREFGAVGGGAAARVDAARAQLIERLSALRHDGVRAFARDVSALDDACSSERVWAMQLFGRRP